MGHLDRAKCTVHSIFEQTSMEGIKCTKAKEYLRAYCSKIYCGKLQECIFFLMIYDVLTNKASDNLAWAKWGENDL